MHGLATACVLVRSLGDAEEYQSGTVLKAATGF